MKPLRRFGSTQAAASTPITPPGALLGLGVGLDWGWVGIGIGLGRGWVGFGWSWMPFRAGYCSIRTTISDHGCDFSHSHLAPQSDKTSSWSVSVSRGLLRVRWPEEQPRPSQLITAGLGYCCNMGVLGALSSAP